MYIPVSTINIQNTKVAGVTQENHLSAQVAAIMVENQATRAREHITCRGVETRRAERFVYHIYI